MLKALAVYPNRTTEIMRGAVCGTLLASMLLAWTFVAPAFAEAAYGIAMHGDPALPRDFAVMPYANSEAHKGGRMVQGEDPTRVQDRGSGSDLQEILGEDAGSFPSVHELGRWMRWSPARAGGIWRFRRQFSFYCWRRVLLWLGFRGGPKGWLKSRWSS